MRGKETRKIVAHGLDRRSLQDAMEFYLRACFRKRTQPRVADFARYLDLARPYVSRRVAELMGAPLTRLFRERQLAHAKHLLRTTPVTVEEVGLASGFGSSLWTFHRRFKAAFGITPGEYRAGTRGDAANRE